MISSNPWVKRKSGGPGQRGLISLRITRPGYAICTECLAELPDESFYVRKRGANGEILKRCPRCKQCEAAAQRAYRAANRERFHQYERERHARDREGRNERARLARLADPERFRQQDQREYVRNRERALATEAARYRSEASMILSRRRLARVVDDAKETYPGGFTVIFIEDVADFRACPLGALRRRDREFPLAEMIPHPDGAGWQVLPWAVVADSAKPWLKKLVRKEKMALRSELVQAGASPEEILRCVGRIS